MVSWSSQASRCSHSVLTLTAPNPIARFPVSNHCLSLASVAVSTRSAAVVGAAADCSTAPGAEVVAVAAAGSTEAVEASCNAELQRGQT